MSQTIIDRLHPLGSVPPHLRNRSYKHMASWLFYGLFWALVVEMVPFVVRQMGGSAIQSLLVRIGQGVPLIFAVLWMPFVQERNPVRLTSLLLVMGGLLTFAAGFFPDLSAFVIALAIGSAFFSAARPTLGTSIEQIYPVKWRGKLLSIPNTAQMTTRTLGLITVGALLRAEPGLYRLIFPLAGVCLIICGLVFRGVPGSRSSNDTSPPPATNSILKHISDSLGKTFSNKVLTTFLIGYFITACGGVTYASALPLFARDGLGLGTDHWGYLRAAFMALTTICLYFWGTVMDRLGAARTAIIAWSLNAALFATTYFVGTTLGLTWIVILRGVINAGQMMVFFPLAMHYSSSSETSGGMALHFSLWGIRWTLTILVVATAIDAALLQTRTFFLLGGLLSTVGVMVMAYAGRLHKRTQNPGTN